MTESPIEGLNHQGSVHARLQLPAHHAAAEQIDPDSEIPPAGCRADVGDVAGPATVGSRGLEVLLQQVLHYPSGASAAPGAGPERLAAPCLS